MKLFTAILWSLVCCASFALAAENCSSEARFNLKEIGFTENAGQWDGCVYYKADVPGASMWFTDEGIYYNFTRKSDISDPEEQRGIHLTEDLPCRHSSGTFEQILIKATLVNGNSVSKPIGNDLADYKCNYFLGNDPAMWKTDVPTYGNIIYKSVYDGIDLSFYGGAGKMEYDFIVSPGVDPGRIRVKYEGDCQLSVNESGELVVETKWGKITEHKPLVYQADKGHRKEIAGEYTLLDANTFGFRLNDEYNPALAVVIDPVISYSTYLGGSGADYANGIAVLGENAYVVGATLSTNFPTLNQYQTDQASTDVFVTKVGISGNSIIYSTYIGGSGSDYGYGIAVDGSGYAYLTGSTASSNFPIVASLQAFGGGIGDAFVAKLNITGNTLIYNTFLGGSAADVGKGIALDYYNNAYVCGGTYSSNFPTLIPYQPAAGGGGDGFVTKINAAGTAKLYSTYLGGTDYDDCTAIAVDSENAYVTGETLSNNFPTLFPVQLYQGAASYYDAFVTKFGVTGQYLDYSTYLGGNQDDNGEGIAVDNDGFAYVTGTTASSNFPKSADAFDSTYNGNGDVFVTKLDNIGDQMVYSTYLGGASDEFGFGIAINSRREAFITGYTNSSDFPIVRQIQRDQGLTDGFVTCLSASGNQSLYSTYLGGSAGGSERGISLATAGSCVYVAGMTFSSDFPTKTPFQTYQGGGDAFVTKICQNVFSVTSLTGSGFGSIRAAIDSANLNPFMDIITFAVSGTISPTTALPTLTDSQTVILGSTAPGGPHSVALSGASIPSGSGINIQSGGNEVEGMTIANFPGSGILVTGANSVHNTLTNNLIHDNGQLGIDLGNNGVTLNDPGDADTGPNDLLNYPVIDSLFMNPDSSFNIFGRAVAKGTVEFYLAHPAGHPTQVADPAGHGEAYVYGGSIIADAAGKIIFTTAKSLGQFSIATATVTDTMGNTSEFSSNFTLVPAPLMVVAYSPVNIIVHDPDGLRFGKDANNIPITEIAPADYFETPHDSVVIYHPKVGTYIIEFIGETDAPPGSTFSSIIRVDGTQQIVIAIDKGVQAGISSYYTYTVTEGYNYINGDANRDNRINVGDAIFLINYIFKSGVAPDPVNSGDANCDIKVNVGDVTKIINYVFKGGQAPCTFTP